MNVDNVKSFRLLNMYEKLSRGDVINKKQFAKEFDVSEKSVQRDIDELRAYLSENDAGVSIEYSCDRGGYHMTGRENEYLTNEEIVEVAKVLFESNEMDNQELNTFIDKLLIWASPSAKEAVRRVILTYCSGAESIMD